MNLYYENDGNTYESVDHFRSTYFNVGFGDLRTEEELAQVGLYFIYDDAPSFDRALQKIESQGIEKIGSRYQVKYVVTARTMLDEERFKIMAHRCEVEMTQHLDAKAQERHYDNRITCALRAGYPGPFQAEGIAFATWMDNCNAVAYGLLAEAQAGTRQLPEDPQQLIDLLPTMVWPN